MSRLGTKDTVNDSVGAGAAGGGAPDREGLRSSIKRDCYSTAQEKEDQVYDNCNVNVFNVFNLKMMSKNQPSSTSTRAAVYTDGRGEDVMQAEGLSGPLTLLGSCTEVDCKKHFLSFFL